MPRSFVSARRSLYPFYVAPLATIVWFRQDLRLADHPALAAACARGVVIPVFIWSPEEEGKWPPGAASRWWLHQSLASLGDALGSRNSRLLLRSGDALCALRDVLAKTGATAVYWSRRYEPAAIERDARVKKALRESGCEAESFKAALLHEPWELKTGAGGPYQVFTPFWRVCLKMPEPPRPLPVPAQIPAPNAWPASETLAAFNLEPKVDWATGLRAGWRPGEAGAQAQLDKFVTGAASSYATGRDLPATEGTSRLSPHLHWGEISPRQIWHALGATAIRRSGGGDESSADVFRREIGWREFAHHLLYHFPRTPEKPLRAEFERLEWARSAKALGAWQRGRTGYPIVDAGMRELWTTGWMHNRVRMIVASFLTKDLLLPWQQGAKWFWDTLVDADLANNTLGWQWSAGCGADAAPFFRIFNPVSQGEKFDAGGSYVRRWVPELAQLPAKWIHRPWEAPPQILRSAGMKLGETYPQPIVNHAEARLRALAAFDGIRKKGKTTK